MGEGRKNGGISDEWEVGLERNRDCRQSAMEYDGKKG
jgi:hypothetical protein